MDDEHLSAATHSAYDTDKQYTLLAYLGLIFTMSLSAPGGLIDPEKADNFEDIEKQFAVKGTLWNWSLFLW